MDISIHDNFGVINEHAEIAFINDFIHEGLEIVSAAIDSTSEIKYTASYELSNGNIITYESGVTRKETCFHRIEIENGCGESIVAKKSDNRNNIITSGYDTVSESVIVSGLEMLNIEDDEYECEF